VNVLVLAMVADPVNIVLAAVHEMVDYKLALEKNVNSFAAAKVEHSRLSQDYMPDFDGEMVQKVYPLGLRAYAPGFDKNGFVAQHTPQKKYDKFLYSYILTQF